MCKKKKIDQSLRKIIEPLHNPFSTCIRVYTYTRKIFWVLRISLDALSSVPRRKRLLTTRFTELHGSRGGERKDWRARLVRTDENSPKDGDGARRRGRRAVLLVVAIRWRRAKKWLIVTLSAICVLLPLQMTDPYRFCYGDRRNDRVKDRARDSREGKGRRKKKKKKQGNFFRRNVGRGREGEGMCRVWSIWIVD